MPTPLKDILAEADRLLESSRFQDYGPNGLQVPGAEQVSTLVTGVSAHVELFERATDADADLILVHHGLFWGSAAGPIDLAMKRRLKLLFDADIALAAYHLPLDAHPQIGNNALLAKALGAADLRPFAVHRNQPIGFLATLPGAGIPARSAEGLFARVEEIMGQKPLVFDAGPETVRSIAIVTGAGTSHLPEAIAAGADAFITGEPAERAMADAQEAGIHFIAAGHYATETFGIRALGEHLAERFGLHHLFIDVRNPI
jgi:dinuclear metal center YbgI/SA1388 family protein